ncbi:MAG: hypothetical protein J6Q54_08150 [Oscillospiraceae bacterium]|nr:hypothetical protein [Oscillospiraceae bacterium]
MKKVYESPKAEVISFSAMEQIATLDGRIRLVDFGDDNFNPGVGSRNDF